MYISSCLTISYLYLTMIGFSIIRYIVNAVNRADLGCDTTEFEKPEGKMLCKMVEKQYETYGKNYKILMLLCLLLVVLGACMMAKNNKAGLLFVLAGLLNMVQLFLTKHFNMKDNYARDALGASVIITFLSDMIVKYSL